MTSPPGVINGVFLWRREEDDRDGLITFSCEKHKKRGESGKRLASRDGIFFLFFVCGGAGSFEETGTVEDAECKHPEAYWCCVNI